MAVCVGIPLTAGYHQVALVCIARARLEGRLRPSVDCSSAPKHPEPLLCKPRRGSAAQARLQAVVCIQRSAVGAYVVGRGIPPSLWR